MESMGQEGGERERGQRLCLGSKELQFLGGEWLREAVQGSSCGLL